MPSKESTLTNAGGFRAEYATSTRQLKARNDARKRQGTTTGQCRTQTVKLTQPKAGTQPIRVRSYSRRDRRYFVSSHCLQSSASSPAKLVGRHSPPVWRWSPPSSAQLQGGMQPTSEDRYYVLSSSGTLSAVKCARGQYSTPCGTHISITTGTGLCGLSGSPRPLSECRHVAHGGHWPM